jgi:membrane AbrB-like protein
MITATLLILGAAGGEAAVLAGTPMPWMLGSLTLIAALAMIVRPRVLDGYSFPKGFRTGFVSIIGVMIGAQVTPELFEMAGGLVWTVSALAVFVGLSHAGNYAIFRRLGGYDRPTAFFSGTPGGLMESILMGEASGADARVLIAQQYLRIVLVITILPFALSLWLGEPVGSAAGLEIAAGNGAPVRASDIALILAAAALGLGLARLIRLPAAQITGPMLVAAAGSLTGVIELHLPVWMIATAQVVIGVSLGVRFQGLEAGLLRRSVGLAALSVGYMLALGAGFAAGLSALTGIAPLHLMIAFAPGGVAEMAVVALSLAANPALVSTHHILRILMTVGALVLLTRVFGFDPAKAPRAGER